MGAVLPSPTLSSSPHRWWVFVIIPLVLSLGVYLGWRYVYANREVASSIPRATGIAITSATAEKGDIGVYIDAIGTVTPEYTASITAQVSGLVTSVEFKEGQTVREGDPLVEINSAPYRATLLQAQGVLERDQNLLAQAQMDAERYRLLWATKAIGKQILDD